MKPSSLIILICVLLIPIVVLIVYRGSDSSTTTNNSTATMTPSASPTPSAGASSVPADVVSAHKVILKTSKGDIAITLYPDEAPRTVKNFSTLGKRGYYNNIVFHRVVKDFMIQSGDPTGTGGGGESIYGAKFENESTSHKFLKGSVGMANAGKDTNGSQFFIMTQQAYPSLDGGYTNFGTVDDEASMKVVQAIGALQIPNTEKPSEEVKITGFEIVQP